MAQANFPWKVDSFYVVASRSPADKAFPHLSFVLCRGENCTKGTWYTGDSDSLRHAYWPSEESDHLLRDAHLPNDDPKHFPIVALPRFPWPDEKGRVPYAIAHLADVRNIEPPIAPKKVDFGKPAWARAWDVQVFESALRRAWIEARGYPKKFDSGLEYDNYTFFRSTIFMLSDASFLVRAQERDRRRVDPSALMERMEEAVRQAAKKNAAARTSDVRPEVVDFQPNCLQGPGAKDLNAQDWGWPEPQESPTEHGPELRCKLL